MRVSLCKKAGFSPRGPEPNWGYVTDTSHPDVELPESLQAEAQVRTVNMEHGDHVTDHSADRNIFKKAGVQG